MATVSRASFMKPQAKGGGGMLGASGATQTKTVGRKRGSSFVVNDATNVRVFVRVRPFNQRELDNAAIRTIAQFEGSNVLLLDPENFQPCGDHTFGFDNAFWSIEPGSPGTESSNAKFSSQSDIYDEVGAVILDNVFQGYNACLFAYGQTGAGKSFTMMGVLDKEELWGITPRLCRGLFERMETEKEISGREYKAEVCYIEIYNEVLRDLLVAGRSAQEVKVKEHPKWGPFIDGAKNLVCTCWQDVRKALDKGDGNRHKAATAMNAESSRSHAVFTVIFHQFKVETDPTGKSVERVWQSKINLIDLAGSERVSESKVEGVNFQEALNINKSLTTLGRVIDALVDLSKGKKGVIPPYRESSLTRVLQDSLGGNSKTMMFANISPSPINFEETLSTLRYSSRARQIINKAHVNTDAQAAFIDGLNAELEALRAQLAAGGGGGGSPQQQEELEAMQKQLEQNQGLISNLERQQADLAKAKSEAEAKAGKLDELEMKEGQMRSQIDELNRSCSDLQSALKDAKDQISKLKQQNSELENEKRNLTSQNADLQTANNEKDALIAKLKAQVADLTDKNGRLDAEKKKYRFRAEERGEEADKYKRMYESTASELSLLQKEVAKSRGTISGLQRELNTSNSRAGDYLTTLAELEERVSSINTELTKPSAPSRSSMDAIVKQLEQGVRNKDFAQLQDLIISIRTGAIK